MKVKGRKGYNACDKVDTKSTEQIIFATIFCSISFRYDQAEIVATRDSNKMSMKKKRKR